MGVGETRESWGGEGDVDADERGKEEWSDQDLRLDAGGLDGAVQDSAPDRGEVKAESPGRGFQLVGEIFGMVILVDQTERHWIERQKRQSLHPTDRPGTLSHPA